MRTADFPHTATLLEARTWLQEEAANGGAACPCCGQRAQQYRRSLNSGMARSLVVMYVRAGGQWINVPTEVGARSREEGKLRYWGLVTEHNAPREDGGHAGWWRVTERGAAFVRKELLVPKYAVVYDGTLIRLEGEKVDIEQCLRNRFNLAELLAGGGL